MVIPYLTWPYHTVAILCLILIVSYPDCTKPYLSVSYHSHTIPYMTASYHDDTLPYLTVSDHGHTIPYLNVSCKGHVVAPFSLKNLRLNKLILRIFCFNTEKNTFVLNSHVNYIPFVPCFLIPYPTNPYFTTTGTVYHVTIITATPYSLMPFVPKSRLPRKSFYTIPNIIQPLS